MSVQISGFKHVSYLWDDAKAASLGDDQVALLIYRFAFIPRSKIFALKNLTFPKFRLRTDLGMREEFGC